MNITTAIEEAFEESDLLFKVDLIDWKHCSKDFQALIAPDLVQLELV